jgi:hypothetical protein
MLLEIMKFFYSLFHQHFWKLGRNPADPKKMRCKSGFRWEIYSGDFDFLPKLFHRIGWLVVVPLPPWKCREFFR